jgi:hypothetical protein
MTDELLMGCFEGLRNNAASGIDGVTKEQYAERLEENLQQLVDRLHGMSYIPQPVVRVNIPKPGSDKLRPLGIPALEDKIVQSGLSIILKAIYEQDYIVPDRKGVTRYIAHKRQPRLGVSRLETR